MALHFVSSADGNDGDSGHTLDLAWATIEHAYEAGVLVAGDTIAVRRTHSETPGSDIVVIYSGTAASPITLFGLHRAAHAITSSDWTNGSSTVNNDDADMGREKHQGRYITAPDGDTYLITRITDASTIVLDREYAGGTVANSGDATIQADDIHPDWTAYDDSGDVIKKADWDADADDLPVLDFNDGDFQLLFQNDLFHVVKNLELKDSADAEGIIRVRRCQQFYMHGCLMKQSAQNDSLLGSQESCVFIERCIFEGSGAGASQRGLSTAASLVNFVHLKDVAIYNCGDNGIGSAAQLFLENVNIGVEIANGDDDITLYAEGFIRGMNVKLGGTNGTILYDQNPANRYLHASIENYGKILGAHMNWFLGGTYEKAAVTGETPNKKVSDDVLKISPNTTGFDFGIEDWSFPILVHEIEMTAAAHTLKYWIYNDSGVTINDGDAKADIWLKAESVKSYDDTSEYTIIETFSAENTIADAADADDWDSLSVTVTPDTASKVRLTIYLSFYVAAGDVFIDPAVVIT